MLYEQNATILTSDDAYHIDRSEFYEMFTPEEAPGLTWEQRQLLLKQNYSASFYERCERYFRLNPSPLRGADFLEFIRDNLIASAFSSAKAQAKPSMLPRVPHLSSASNAFSN